MGARRTERTKRFLGLKKGCQWQAAMMAARKQKVADAEENDEGLYF